MLARRLVSLARGNSSVAAAASAVRAYSSIDVHTHIYQPEYMKLMRSRTEVPKVLTINGEDRLVILPGEDAEQTTAVGRPIGEEYHNIQRKIDFMDAHNIDKSIVSLANPWLDFLTNPEASMYAAKLNDELEDICANSNGRLLGFATVPVTDPQSAANEVRRIKNHKHIKGLILGTSGAGKGLDDVGLEPLLGAMEETGMLGFIHPHYGVGTEHFHNTGHALFLALGFPFETTVAAARMIVCGTFDKFPGLKLMLAHSGGALPALIGRLDSCVVHDIAVANRLQHAPSEYLKRMYFDAIGYTPENLTALASLVGPDRIMFGTDNPFFPPPGVDIAKDPKAQWLSTNKIYHCIDALDDASVKDKILRENAKRIFNI